MKFDVVVVGAGHAGCEAAWAAAGMGCDVAVVTLDPNRVAAMPCNPSIGGSGKAQLVREVDALGGLMGRAIDAVHLQMRMLNRRKGPAARALRAQADREGYSREVRRRLCERPGVKIICGEVKKVILRAGRAVGVELDDGWRIRAGAVVLACGTYLESTVWIGMESRQSGPWGQRSARGLSEWLSSEGVSLRRFKTGTSPRIRKDSVRPDAMIAQPGEGLWRGFSFWAELPRRPQKDSWLTYTRPETHALIRAHLHETALFGGAITGIGPRYCPSIESKLVWFPDRERHQIFVEPESEATDEWYLAGLSTSLPPGVQAEVLRTIPGLRRAEIVRPGYAIEYDAIEATALRPTLESREVAGLFFAGQINGTSGYEEAAAQGLMAGINAVLSLRGEEPLVLRRDQAYIGVLIDEIVTKESDEPFRMLTARVEHRLLLRGETADLRLAEIGHHLGLISAEEYGRFLRRKERLAEAEKLLETRRAPGAELSAWAQRHRTAVPTQAVSLKNSSADRRSTWPPWPNSSRRWPVFRPKKRRRSRFPSSTKDISPGPGPRQSGSGPWRTSPSRRSWIMPPFPIFHRKR